jgi:phage shock protein E
MANRLCLAVLLTCLSLTVPMAVIAQEPLWIDVRTAKEFDQQHVEQAINIPYEQVVTRFDTVTSDKDALIYVYCRSGRRSGIAKSDLDELGYTRVINVGGLDEALTKSGQKPNP